MKSRHDPSSKRPPLTRSAAEWFVALDSGAMSADEDAALAAWLAADPDNAVALARCGVTFELARQLSGDQEWPAARSTPDAGVAAATFSALRAWLGRPIVAWGISAVALLVAGAGWLREPAPVFVPELGVAPSAETPVAASTAAGAAPGTYSWSGEPVVVLPGQVVVDARSIAVRPFELRALPEDEDAAAATDLHAQIVNRLSAIPGFYVLASESIEAFSLSDMSIAEIAAQLGVRSIVEARVSVEEQQIHVELRLTDASTSARLLDDAYVRSMDEIEGMPADIVANIALAMTGPADPDLIDQ